MQTILFLPTLFRRVGCTAGSEAHSGDGIQDLGRAKNFSEMDIRIRKDNDTKMRNHRATKISLGRRKCLRIESLEVRRLLSASPLNDVLHTERVFLPQDTSILPQDTSITSSGFDLAGWETLTIGVGQTTTSFEAASARDLLFDEALAPTASLPTGGDAQASLLGSFDIIVNPGATLAGNQPALDAFNRAAEQWEAFISDPIIVTIDADLVNLGSPNTIGSASSVILQVGYTTLRDQMVADADSDDGILASLPTKTQFNATLPPGIRLTGLLTGHKSSMKAMGFTGLDTTYGASDGSISFNTQFSFDFDNSDGVTSGTMDFQTVASHEIGHALGFTSIVDTVDAMLDAGSRGKVSPRALDLFRFETGSDPSTAGEFTTFTRNLDTGGNPVFDDTDDQWRFSTGAATGDGRQASHWKDNNKTGVLIGIMDPTFSKGQIITVAAPDLRALDVIGYDILTAANQAPVLGPIESQIIDEGSQLALTATATDPDVGDQLTFSLGAGAPAGASIHPTSGALTWTPEESSALPVSIEIIVTDNGSPNFSDSETVQVTVNNVAPMASIAGPSGGVPFQARTFTLTAADPSPADQAAGFTFDIDWDGDDVVDQIVIGPSGTEVIHQYLSVSANTIQVTATDQDAGASDVATHAVNIVRVEMQGADLVWGGTSGGDAVEFEETAAQTVEVRATLLNGVVVSDTQTFVGVTGQVIAFGGDGADIIDAGRIDGLTNIGATLIGGRGHDTINGGGAADTIRGDAEGDGSEGRDVIDGGGGDDLIYGDGMEGAADTIMGGDGNDTIYGDNGDISADGAKGNDVIYGDDGDDWLFGGNGNDSIFGGNGNDIIDGEIGNDILSGGTGNDSLSGGTGKDLLFAGVGADTLHGNGGDDLLVAGATSFDFIEADLNRIGYEWWSSGSYATRVANIGGAGGLNDPVFLQPGTTVFDDGDVDTLFGEGGTDWFLDNQSGLTPDILSDLEAGEVETDIAP